MLPKLAFVTALFAVAGIFLATHCPGSPGCGHEPGGCPESVCLEFPGIDQSYLRPERWRRRRRWWRRWWRHAMADGDSGVRARGCI
jgi:hypothetical protein